MSYQRQVRESPNQVYEEINREEVKYLFDVLTDNSLDNLVRETGYDRNFISTTINSYLIKHYKS